MYRVSECYSKWIVQLQLCFKGKSRSQLYKHQSNIPFVDVMLELLPDSMQKTIVHIHICFISSFTVILRLGDTLFMYFSVIH